MGKSYFLSQLCTTWMRTCANVLVIATKALHRKNIAEPFLTWKYILYRMGLEMGRLHGDSNLSLENDDDRLVLVRLGISCLISKLSVEFHGLKSLVNSVLPVVNLADSPTAKKLQGAAKLEKTVEVLYEVLVTFQRETGKVVVLDL